MTTKAPTGEVGHATGLGSAFGVPIDAAEQAPQLAWPLNIAVYGAMRTDAKLRGVRNAVTLPVRRAMWRVNPNGAPDNVARFLADDLGLPLKGEKGKPVRRRRQRFDFTKHVRSALLSLEYGHMAFEKSFVIGADGLAHLVLLGDRLPSTLAKINVARNGMLEGVEQYPTGNPGDVGQPYLKIDTDRLVFYSHEREGGLWQGQSIYRSAYPHWLLKDRLMRVDAVKHERNGMGVPTFEAPEGAPDGVIRQLNDLASRFRASDSASMAHPFGAKFYLKGVDGSLPDTLASIRYHDEQMAEETLTSFLGLDTSPNGSRALGEALIDFFVLALQAEADEIADTTNEQLMELWVDWNWGEDMPVPTVECDPIGEDASITAEALSSLVTCGALQPDATLDAYVRSHWRLPERDAAFPWTPPAAPAPRAGVGAGGRRRDPFVVAADAASGNLETAPSWVGADFLDEFCKAYAPLIEDAIAGLFDADTIAQEWTSIHAAEGDDFASGLDVDLDAITDTWREMTGDAYIGGDAAARDLLDQVGALVNDAEWGTIDWSQWSPGYTRAAAEVAGKDGTRGLAGLLDQAGVTIQGITDTTRNYIGTQLSYALDHGWSSQQLARELASRLRDPIRAQTIAQTEMARAMTVASMDTYREHNVESKEWLLSDDACDLCIENADEGVVPLDYDWPNDEPPVHPNCVCAVAPVVAGQSGEGEA